MRITNRMMLENVLREMRTMQGRLVAAQEVAVTGRKIRQASDGPIDTHRLMKLEHALRISEQFQQNAASARTRLGTEDEVIETVRDLVARIKGLGLNISADVPADPGRQAALQELNLALESVIAFGNTQVGTEYIFGGDQTTTPPFQAIGTYVGDSTERQIELADGVVIYTNHPGNQLLGSTIQELQNLAQELQTGTVASIHSAAAALDAAEQDLLGAQAEIGARLRHVDSTDRYLTRKINSLLDQRNEIQHVDSAEALFKFLDVQQSIVRASAVLGRVINTSTLIDQLR